MDRFSLDDVGDSFRQDIGAVLATMPTGLTACQTLASGATAPTGLAAALEQVIDGCHTISGSSSLVGAIGLVRGSQVLHRLTVAAQAAALDLDAAARRLLALTNEAQAALPVLERVLELELAHGRSAADTMVDQLGARCDALIAGRPFTELAPDDEGFDFDERETTVPESTDEVPFALLEDESAPSAAPAEIDDFTAAVREAFAQEAGDLLAEMDHLALELERGGAVGPLVRELFRAYHTLKGSANTVGLVELGTAAHAAEDHLETWSPETIDARAAATALLRIQRDLRATIAGEAAAPTAAEVSDAFRRGLRESESQVQPAPTATPIVVEEAAPGERRSLRVAAEHLDRLMRLAGELVTTRSRLGARLTGLAAIQRELTASRTRLVATVDGFRERHEFAGLDGGRNLRSGTGRTHNRVEALFTDLELDRYEDIHVLSRSLAEITGDIGELHQQIARNLSGIGEDSESLATAVSGIQGEITRARMVNLEALFARLHLAAQDAADRAGHPVRVTLAGAAVALDRAIVDGIATPLLHLVRNAVAHGIEAGEDRELAGKSSVGNLSISARQEGGLIVVEVRDDGAGLNLPKLHRRGCELGLIDETTAIDSEIVRQLVFVPGLSTATHTDSVSGRGIGCDVARQEIQRLNGTITVSSTTGVGTTFTVTLPLTLAISRALEVIIGGARYAVPMNFIDRILDLETAHVSFAAGIRRVAFAGGQVRLIDLGHLIAGAPVDRTLRGPALMVRLGERRWALRVDGLVRQDDIVVGSLGELLAGHPLFAGVTLAGTGALIPIIDIPGLLARWGSSTAVNSAALASPTEPARPRQRTRVLFVDDSVSVRRVAEQQLTALGIDVVLAVDGEDALSRLRQEPVDLVFTDLEMPRMHGYDLIRELRYVPAWANLPVIVVSSRVGDKHRALADQLGANGYLPKPFTPEQLSAALGRWTQR